MAIIDFCVEQFKRLHADFDAVVAGLTPEHLHWRPAGQANHIAFVIWHYSRTEDNIIQFVLQRQPTIWMEEGWHETLGLDSKAQGTGMAAEDAAALRLPSVEEFAPYMRKVWDRTEAYLATLSESDLERTTMIRPQGERRVMTILTESMLTHGFSHLGEIWVLRSLQGLEGAPF